MKEISVVEIEERFSRGEELNIIDVRESDELANGKIPNVIHIPLGLIEAKMNELDKSKDYFIICLSGGRSGRAAKQLESKGYRAVNIKEGMLGWDGTIEKA